MRNLIATAILLAASPLAAQNMTAVTIPEPLDDMEFAVESAIIDMGLTIDFTSHSGAMLERTREDVGSDIVLFTGATIYNFCSATVSRQVIEADINNIIYCPYSIYLYSTPDNPDETIIGHQTYPGESMQPANDLLDAIIASATQ
ncbi:MAG: DUF302 domain-containing protein [Rhodobacteraceae bacterium]|nr:DUF302 domain-containing protein [Paracoccaceae bacterium]